MMETRIRQTVLLEDTPAEHDAFSAPNSVGPHHRLAAAISKMMTDESGGRMVGLEGGWGSGKSTVVSLLLKNLESSRPNQIASVIFDAWAHEGDPLRRTFIESLVRGLQKKNWVDAEAWNKRLDTISNRRRESETKSTSRPTPLAYSFAISLLFVPLGTAFLGAAFKNGITLDFNANISWLFVVGFLFSIAPCLVLLWNLVRYLKRKALGQDIPAEFWSFSGSHGQVTTNSTTLESQNPTSIEFEQYFEELMSDSLGQKGSEERRFLLVLDNLDRVEPSLALELWSTLQTYLHGTSSRLQPWFRRIWIIVPFDGAGLRKLWDNRSSNEASPSEVQVASDSFLDKSFQIRFFVPPLVLSDWKRFLINCLEIALPEHTAEERHEVFRVYDQFCLQVGKTPPTPRQLKLYVNQIGAVHRQWGDEISIGHVAYFVLKNNESVSLISRLRDGEIPCDNAKRILGDRVSESLAGLLFNTTPERGLELLLEQPIHVAMLQMNQDDLRSIVKRHGDGFWSVLEQVVIRKWPELESAGLACVATSVLAAELHSFDRPEARSAVRGLKNRAQSLRTWAQIDSKVAEGIASLCQCISDLEFTKELMARLASGSRLASDDKELVIIELDGMLRLLPALEKLGHDLGEENIFSFQVDSDGWMELATRIDASIVGKKYCRNFLPTCQAGELVQSMVAIVNGGSVTPDFPAAIRVTQNSALLPDWEPLISAIRQRMDPATSPAEAEIVPLLTALLQLNNFNSPGADTAVADLSSAIALHYFQTFRKNSRIRGICLYLFLKQHPNLQQPPSAVGNSESGLSAINSMMSNSDADLPEAVLDLIEQWHDWDLIHTIIRCRPHVDPFFADVLEFVAHGNFSHLVFTLDFLREFWVNVSMAVDNAAAEFSEPITAHDILSKLKPSFSSTLISENSPIQPTEIAFFKALVESNPEITDLNHWCRSCLEKLSKDQWQKDFSGSYGFTELVLALSKKGLAISLYTAFEDALLELGQRIAANGNTTVPSHVRADWDVLINSLGEGSIRKTFRDRLLQNAIGSAPSISKEFFELFGHELADSETLLSEQKTVSQLFSPLLSTRNVAGLVWLREFIEGNPNFLNEVDLIHTVEEFEQRVREALTNPAEDDSQNEITAIARILELEPAEVSSGNPEERESDQQA